MVDSTCDIKGVKTATELLNYVTSNDVIQDQESIAYLEMLKSITCSIPPGPKDLTIPKEDYELLKEDIGKIYDAFSDNAEISKGQFVNNLFEVALSLGNHDQGRVEELDGGARTRKEKSSASDTATPEEEKPLPREHYDDINSDNSVTTYSNPEEHTVKLIPVEVLQSGVVILSVYITHKYPMIIALSPTMKYALRTYGPMVAGEAINLSGKAAQEFLYILQDSMELTYSTMVNNPILSKVISSLSSFGGRGSYSVRLLLMVSLFCIFTLLFLDQLVRDINTILNNSSIGMLPLVALKGNLQTLKYIFYGIIESYDHLSYIVPSIIDTLKPVYGSKCAFAAEGLNLGKRFGLPYIDELLDHAKLLEINSASDCIVNNTVTDLKNFKDPIDAMFSFSLPLAILGTRMLIYINPEPVLSNKLESMERSLKRLQVNHKYIKLAVGFGAAALYVADNYQRRGGKSKSRRRRKAKKAKKKTRKQHKRKTRKSGKKKAKKHTNKKR
jgi:hypothetical protein